MTAPHEARDGVLIPVGCPNCYHPDNGAHRMRVIETMDAPHNPHRWRRSILECEACGHAVLIDITLANLDHTDLEGAA